MPYHIDEENSELAFEVREGNKLVIKIKSNIFSDSLELYLIKVGDNTEPTDKNVFSSLRVLKEIENLHDTILKEINSVTSGFWELKQDSQGNEYISTKYNVLTEGGLTTYGLGEQKLGTIYDGLPIDNDTIYWEEVEGSRVLKAKGSGGEAGSVQWGNISGKPTWIEDTKPSYSWSDITGEKPFYTKEEIASKYVTIDTEQEITALKHFTAGLSVGESKKKIYEENGVVYIDADVAVTGGMTFYATAGRSVSTIMDAIAVDGITIKKENNVLKAVAGAGSSFDENAMWVALATSNSEKQIDKSHITTALTGYATESWVSQNYATASALASVSNKLNDFLEGSDTDEIINKWKELEAFLSGMAETDNLAEILETKADKKYVDSTFVTLGTKQTITGEKTFSSVLNTSAIKASGAITAPSLAASDWVTIAGIKLRKLEDGALILEGNLALTGALTMYATGAYGFDTIYDGLPIDNDTIYWSEVEGSKVLKAKEGSGSSFDKSAMWTALAGSTTEQINKSHLTTALTGYATESWVSGKNYAVKATTLAGYGITDAYTKTESDNKYPAKTGSGASGTWGINVTGNAGSATKLQTARTLWGRSFDGTGNVSGNLDNVGNIIPSSDNNFILGSDEKHFEGVYTRVLRNNVGRTMYISQNANANLELQANATTMVTIKPNGDILFPFFAISKTSYLGADYAVQIRTDSYNPYIAFYRDKQDWYVQAFQGFLQLGVTADKSVKVDNVGNLSSPGNMTANSFVGSLNGNATSATKLQTSRSLWGQSFNGEKDISGSLSNVGNIVPSSDNTYTLGDSTRHFDGVYVRVLRNNVSRDMYISQNTAKNLIFQTSGVNRVIITHNGNFQVGSSFVLSNETQDTSYSVRVKTESYNPYLSLNQDGNIWYIQGYNGYLYLGSTSANSIRIDSSGNILAPGGGTYYGSDIRYKSIMLQVNLSLLDIAKAPSFVYHWNRSNMNQNRLNLGGSAQYTQSVLPWAVEENDNFLSMDYATVAYTFAVHTARHLLTYETRTDKKIKKLENRVKYLEKQLKKLGYEEVRTLDDQSV